MSLVVLSKREFFNTTFTSELEKLNTAISSGFEHYIENGEVVVDMADFPEFEHKSIREYLLVILKEAGWNADFQTGNEEDWLLLN